MDDMYSDADHSELVRQIQQGDRNSLDHLAHLAKGRLRAYIYRLTLDHDLTEDLLQETLLHMVESLRQLERTDAIWPWLYRTALGKVQHHYRGKAREAEARRLLLARAARPSSCVSMDGSEGLSATVRKELLEAIFEAIGTLNLRQRGVLVLRCFEQRSYAEIATIMDCSETAAQVLFFRAKRSLRGHLSHRGFKTGLLFIGLGMFARRTASAGAPSVTGVVSCATLEVGVLAKLVAIVGTRLAWGLALPSLQSSWPLPAGVPRTRRPPTFLKPPLWQDQTARCSRPRSRIRFACLWRTTLMVTGGRESKPTSLSRSRSTRMHGSVARPCQSRRLSSSRPGTGSS